MSNASPTLGHVHTHQKHRKKGIGVQLGNIHQRDKTKEGSKKIHPSLSSSEISGSAKKTKGTKKASHPSHHKLALSIICLVLFHHLESFRQSYVFLIAGLSEDISNQPFTVIISVFSLFLFVSIPGYCTVPGLTYLASFIISAFVS